MLFWGVKALASKTPFLALMSTETVRFLQHLADTMPAKDATAARVENDFILVGESSMTFMKLRAKVWKTRG
jgi:hypothetical protein